MSEAADLVESLLSASRRREKAQTLFYRALAAEAEAAGNAAGSERLNELHADEQHHLARLTARLLELGHTPEDLRGIAAPGGSFPLWEDEARAREGEEIVWYQEMLALELDALTREIVEEILDSERRHRAELRGKWMSA